MPFGPIIEWQRFFFTTAPRVPTCKKAQRGKSFLIRWPRRQSGGAFFMLSQKVRQPPFVGKIFPLQSIFAKSHHHHHKTAIFLQNRQNTIYQRFNSLFQRERTNIFF